MYDHYLAQLTHYRNTRSAWAELSCGADYDADGHWHDPNARARYRALIALQYDLRAEDAALARYLLEQEAIRHHKEPFQGLYPALDLAAFLVASFCDVNDIWLFWQAKYANFDTACGLDAQYFASGGIEEALTLVKGTDRREREDILEYLEKDGRAYFTPDEVARWWEAKRAYYPTDPTQEAPMAHIERALDLGEHDEASRWLREWEADQPRDVITLRRISYYREELGDWDQAIAAQAELVAIPARDPFTTAGDLQRLVNLSCRAGRYAAAWDTVLACELALVDDPKWQVTGLGRMLVEDALTIAAAVPPDDPLRIAAFQWADRYIRHGAVFSLHLAQLAGAVAIELGQAEAATWYERREREEAARIARHL